jgi:hypothetical protein
MSNQSQGHPDIHWPAGFTPPYADCFRYSDMAIYAPPARVFQLLADAVRWPEWVPDVASLRILTPTMAQLQPECSFEIERDNLRLEALIGEYIPDSRLGWSGIGIDIYFVTG